MHFSVMIVSNILKYSENSDPKNGCTVILHVWKKTVDIINFFVIWSSFSTKTIQTTTVMNTHRRPIFQPSPC